MKRKRRVKITVTRRRKLSFDPNVTRAVCPVCGHEFQGDPDEPNDIELERRKQTGLTPKFRAKFR